MKNFISFLLILKYFEFKSRKIEKPAESSWVELSQAESS